MSALRDKLEESYARCIAVTKARAGNFHFAFRLLPGSQYRGICALYAFARRADDLSDDHPGRECIRAHLARWRAAFDAALAGDPSADLVLPAVADTVRRCRIPPVYLHEMLAGAEMDASVLRYPAWEDCYRYCYRVASVVGLMTIHVFGFSSDRALPLAERTGIAFQLTNILRDVKEDAGHGRIYLPLEDLRRFGVSEEQVLAGRDSPDFRNLVRFQVRRAREYYAAGEELLPLVNAPCRPALAALVAIYRRLLEEIERRDCDVLSRRVSLSRLAKLRLAGSFAGKLLRERSRTRPGVRI